MSKAALRANKTKMALSPVSSISSKSFDTFSKAVSVLWHARLKGLQEIGKVETWQYLREDCFFKNF